MNQKIEIEQEKLLLSYIAYFILTHSQASFILKNFLIKKTLQKPCVRREVVEKSVHMNTERRKGSKGIFS